MRGLLLTGCVALSIGVDDGGKSVDAGGWNGQPVDGQQGIFEFGVRVGDQLEAASSVTGVFGDSTASLLQAEAEGTHEAAKQTIKALTTILDSLVAAPNYAAEVDGMKSKVNEVKAAVNALQEAHTANLEELEREHGKAMELANGKVIECNEAKGDLETTQQTCTEAVEALDEDISGKQREFTEKSAENSGCISEKCDLLKKIILGKTELGADGGTLPFECALLPADDQTKAVGKCVIIKLTEEQAAALAQEKDPMASQKQLIAKQMKMNGYTGKITGEEGGKYNIAVTKQNGTPKDTEVSGAHADWLTVVRNDSDQVCAA